MGEHGKVSRLLSPLFGGFFTFASLEQGSETAPGQMSIKEMRSAYELLGLKLEWIFQEKHVFAVSSATR